MKAKTPIILFFLIFTLAFTGDKSKSTYTIPMQAYSVTAGDIDLDGDNDIIVGHKNSAYSDWHGFSMLKNTNHGYFGAIDSFYVENGFPNVYSGHFNNNEYLDFFSNHVTSNPYTVWISLFLDYGLYEYDSVKTISISTVPVHNYAMGDINMDQNQDIVFSSSNGQFWGIIYNDGQGNFSEPEYYDIPECYSNAIACGDLNNDGRNDIVVSGFYTKIYYSYDDGFDIQDLDVPAGTIKLSIVDFDMDGDQDILVFTNFAISMFENMGNETFEAKETLNIYPNKQFFFVSDLNNDEFKDVVAVCGNLSGINIYYNQGGFELSEEQFVPISTTDPQEQSRKIYCEDMDGNGYQDIIVTKRNEQVVEDNLEILFNHGDGNFLPNPVSILNNQQNNSYSFGVYPNPFKQKATFEINIPKAAQIEIIIYDLKGKTVQLFPFEKGAGLHYIEVNAEGMPSGVYYYSLFINNQYIDTKKMLILK